jgi:hypothetical protein
MCKPALKKLQKAVNRPGNGGSNRPKKREFDNGTVEAHGVGSNYSNPLIRNRFGPFL